MDDSNVKAQDTLVRLRQRVLDLQKVSPMDSEAFGTYQQTVLQIWKECEGRRQTCMSQAQDYLKKAEAAQSQAGAFSIMASIMYSVVNGFVEAEEKRLREEAERAAEAKEHDADTPAPTEPEKPSKRGRKRKTPKDGGGE